MGTDPVSDAKAHPNISHSYNIEEENQVSVTENLLSSSLLGFIPFPNYKRKQEEKKKVLSEDGYKNIARIGDFGKDHRQRNSLIKITISEVRAMLNHLLFIEDQVIHQFDYDVIQI